MKRILFLFISLMICVCGYSQKHMKFQGIEIDGTKKAFVDQLIKKGYRYDGTSNNTEMLSGTFTNKNAIIAVSSNSDDNVIAVSVALSEGTKWNTLLDEYNYYKKLYSQKYGIPVKVNEKDPTNSDNNDFKMMNLEDGRLQWECWFETNEGEILLTIQSTKREFEDNTGCILIMYRDKANFKKRQSMDIDDI